MIENEITQACVASNVSMLSNSLSHKGIAQIGDVLSPFVSVSNIPGQIALKRFVRTSNSFIVLDDDLLILRIMEHMLSPYGHVETYATVRDFLPAYQRQAPNQVFLDINLKDDERGTNLAFLLSEKIDPGGHIVMISGDAIKSNVLESRFKGAKGFISKPVSPDLVIRHVMSASTLYQRY